MTLLMAILSLSFVLNCVINVSIPNHTYADDSISLSIDTNNISLNLSPKTATGQFAESNSANISASTTSNSGYTLSITSFTGSTDLTNASNTNAKITSISSNLTNSDFSNSANTQYNNKWGYKPSQYVVVDGDTHTTVANTGNNAVFKPLPNTSGEILAITDQANASNTPDNYTISMGARANNDTLTGSYASAPFVIMAVANSSVLPCDSSKLCVEYDGNGLNFDGELINRVNYDSGTTQQEVTKYSHTSNISDAGVQDGDYPDDANLNDVVTISGATSLHITLTYGGESGYDWTSIWQGNHPDYSAEDDYSSGIQSCGTATSNDGMFDSDEVISNVECDIEGDSVTFGFHSDSSSAPNGYGYYAIITGTGTVPDRTVASGEYAIPTGTNAFFHGWSSTRTTAGVGLPSEVEYADESEVRSKIPGDNGEEKVLYAVWQQGQQITFTKDANVSSIDVLNSDGTTVETITASGQSLVLAQGSIYTIKPTYTAGYTTNAITNASGEGTISGDVRERQFTVGAGSATINITSRQMLPMQNYSCSNLANVGDTDMVYDTRDNQAYLIGKLKDSKCWMLENLNLAGGKALSSDDTDITSAYIDSFSTSNNLIKDGNTMVLPASSTSGFNTNNYSYVYNSGNKANCGASDQNTPCYSYYSWDAATLGSGRTISTDDTDAPYSICPKGWKLPTSRITSATDWQTTSDFYRLAHQYGLDSTTSADENDNGFYTQAGPGTTPNFLLAGVYDDGSFYGEGSSGNYWSSTSNSNTSSARFLNFYSSSVDSVNYGDRYLGFSVRCILKTEQ
ncbi:hypothetical protein IKE99_02060 [Candidatus Saccharibacteria bacterium]|nr:hypothetical protein [Candidatus Saccharibacteria bacterium]